MNISQASAFLEAYKASSAASCARLTIFFTELQFLGQQGDSHGQDQGDQGPGNNEEAEVDLPF